MNIDINLANNVVYIHKIDTRKNEVDTTQVNNTWTYVGLHSLFFNSIEPNVSPYGSYHGHELNIEAGSEYITPTRSRIVLTNSPEQVTLDTEDIPQYLDEENTVPVTTIASTELVNVWRGRRYDSIGLTYIDGIQYLELRHLRSFGDLTPDFEIKQILFTSTHSSTRNLVHAGHTLSEPLVLEDYEQLLVEYIIYIPANLVGFLARNATNHQKVIQPDEFDEPLLSRAVRNNEDLYEAEHTMTLWSKPYIFEITSNNVFQYFSPKNTLASATSQTAVLVNDSTSRLFNAGRVESYDIQYENLSYEAKFDIIFPPVPLEEVTISSLHFTSSVTALPTWVDYRHNYISPKVSFDPPYTKVEENSLIISVQLSIELDYD